MYVPERNVTLLFSLYLQSRNVRQKYSRKGTSKGSFLAIFWAKLVISVLRPGPRTELKQAMKSFGAKCNFYDYSTGHLPKFSSSFPRDCADADIHKDPLWPQDYLSFQSETRKVGGDLSNTVQPPKTKGTLKAGVRCNAS